MKLYTAVIKEAQEQKKFSAHNLTTGIRSKVENNLIVLDDVGQISHPVTGNLVAEVAHNVVNETLKEVYDQQVLPLKREHTGGFYTYQLEDSAPLTSVTTTNAQKPIVWIPNIGGLSAKAASKLPATFGQVLFNPTNDLENKIAFYVNSKRQANQPATLRGVHSSIKTKGVKILDISRICGKLGYTVVTKTPTYQSEIK